MATVYTDLTVQSSRKGIKIDVVWRVDRVQLIGTYEKFQRFYQNKHSNRKLQWLWQHSKGELRATYFTHTKAGYTFQVSAYQMAILLQYNESTQFGFDELQTRTGLLKETLVGPLEILVKAKVLMLGAGEELGGAKSSYSLNVDFKSKKTRINLNMPVKAEQKQETEDTNRTAEEDRKILIQVSLHHLGVRLTSGRLP